MISNRSNQTRNSDLDHLRAAIDADRSRLCLELGLRPDGKRFFCPFYQTDGKPHATGDLSVEAGFKCHKCDWKGDGFNLIQDQRKCDFPAAVEFARHVYGKFVDGPQQAQSNSPAKKTGKIHRTPEEAIAAVLWTVENDTGVKWSVTDIYVYMTAAGLPSLAVVRFDRADGSTDENKKRIKTYRPIHPVDGGWRLGDPRDPLPLFELPSILKGDGVIYITEGEKAAKAGALIGLLCTTTAHGAKSPSKTDLTPLRGRHVVILRDNDEAGHGYAEAMAQLCHAAGAASVKIVLLPELPPKGDLADFVGARSGRAIESVRAEVEAAAEATEVWSQAKVPDVGGKPTILLPGGSRTITSAGEDLGLLLAPIQKVFIRGGVLVTIDADGDGHPILRQLKPVALASVFESVAHLARMTPKGPQPDICYDKEANLIGSSAAFRDITPPIRILTRCPVLIERNGQLVQITGYDRESGIMAGGRPVTDMSLAEALPLLYETLRDFRFATPADQARALAALITPTLVFGGLLKGRPPIDLGEADDSQAGKGYRNKIKSRVYGEIMRCISQKRDGGVGSMEEAFNSALIQGAVFICLENVRGKIDSPAIESFTTEDHYTARCAYHENVDIDPRRVCLSMTSNKADMTTDLANRCSCVRIQKQAQDYAYARYAEGDILDHVAAYQSHYLGAVFAVVRAWHAAGCPRTDERRHDFRAWAQPLDWIVQNLLDAGPLLDGHRETQSRMTNPSLNWLRDAAIAVVKARQVEKWLRAGDLVDLLAEAGVDVPGLPEGGDPSEPNTRKLVQQAVGRKLGQCFRDGDLVAIDSYTVRRQTTYNEQYRSESREYWFSAAGHGPADGPTAAGLRTSADANAAARLNAFKFPPPSTPSAAGGELNCGWSAAKAAANETHAAADAAEGPL